MGIKAWIALRTDDLVGALKLLGAVRVEPCGSWSELRARGGLYAVNPPGWVLVKRPLPSKEEVIGWSLKYGEAQGFYDKNGYADWLRAKDGALTDLGSATPAAINVSLGEEPPLDSFSPAEDFAKRWSADPALLYGPGARGISWSNAGPWIFVERPAAEIASYLELYDVKEIPREEILSQDGTQVAAFSEEVLVETTKGTLIPSRFQELSQDLAEIVEGRILGDFPKEHIVLRVLVGLGDYAKRAP